MGNTKEHTSRTNKKNLRDFTSKKKTGVAPGLLCKYLVNFSVSYWERR
jgi:hypothetical protein